MMDYEKMEEQASKTLFKILADRDLSINKLAGMINDAGYSVKHPTLGVWIRNPHKMKYGDIIVLGEVLGITIEQMNKIFNGKKVNV